MLYKQMGNMECGGQSVTINGASHPDHIMYQGLRVEGQSGVGDYHQ